MELNPFLSIWTRPKETIRQVIRHNKLSFSVLLVCVAGIGGVITSLQNSGFFQDLSTWQLAIGILIAGIINGFLNLGISSLLYTGIGKLYGGNGKLRDMATAIGPMMIPQIFILPLLLIYIAIYGKLYFTAPVDFAITAMPLGAYLFLLLATMTASIWSLVISAKAIGVVHGFSSLRGLGVLLTIAAVFIFFGLIIGIAVIMYLF